MEEPGSQKLPVVHCCYSHRATWKSHYSCPSLSLVWLSVFSLLPSVKCTLEACGFPFDIKLKVNSTLMLHAKAVLTHLPYLFT